MPATRITHPPVALDPAVVWTPCPTCWGQRRIFTREQAANGEGAVLVETACEACLGLGEVAAA